MRHLPASLAVLCAVGLGGPAWAEDWLNFRGTDGTSVATAEKLPTEFDPERHIAWKVELPGDGVSCPIVIGNRVIVTASSGPQQDLLHVVCFDANTGEQRWQRRFFATGRTLHHPTSAVAANTPTSDGQYIYALFSSNDVVCLDLEGNLQWFRGLTHDYPTAANDVGMASSPLVIGNTLIVQVESQGDSFVAGLDTVTGENRWKLARPREANWSSPTPLYAANNEPLVLLQSGAELAAHRPATGEKVWTFAGGCSTICSPVVAGDTLYVPCNGITAVQPQPSGDVTLLWEDSKLGVNAASPLVVDDKLYIANRAGVVVCANTADGTADWKLRLKGSFWATPVAAAGHLYFVNQEGLFQVVQLGEKGKLIAEHSFEEPILATPAIGGNALYLRGEHHLWKLADVD